MAVTWFGRGAPLCAVVASDTEIDVSLNGTRVFDIFSTGISAVSISAATSTITTPTFTTVKATTVTATNISGTGISGTNLSGTNVFGVGVSGTNLSGTTVYGVTFSAASTIASGIGTPLTFIGGTSAVAGNQLASGSITADRFMKITIAGVTCYVTEIG